MHLREGHEIRLRHAVTQQDRLAISVADVADMQEDLEREVTGPPAKVAFDDEGVPMQTTPIIEAGVLRNFITDLRKTSVH